MAGHVAPEAADDGPIAYVRDGDMVTFDVEARRLDVDADIAARWRKQRAVRARIHVHARRDGEVRRTRGIRIRRGRYPAAPTTTKEPT